MAPRSAARRATRTSSRRPGRDNLGLVAAPVAVVRRQIELHGQSISFLEAGADSGGPVIVFLHGLASSSCTWESVLPHLGQASHVIALDLLGHGASAKPTSGDYSLGAYAAELRDLLFVLGADRATVVGHSFGGGVAMQYAYQFPELVERVALVSSGGLGSDVTPALRAATLPGASAVLHTAAADRCFSIRRSGIRQVVPPTGRGTRLSAYVTLNPTEMGKPMKEAVGEVQHDTTLPGLSFGGVKRSGFGRDLGRWGMGEFVNTRLRRTSTTKK